MTESEQKMDEGTRENLEKFVGQNLVGKLVFLNKEQYLSVYSACKRSLDETERETIGLTGSFK